MSKSNLLIGVLAGVAAGAILGVLFAPGKGSETRKKIADQTGKLTDSLGDTFNGIVDNLSVTKEGVKNTANAGKAKTETASGSTYSNARS